MKNYSRLEINLLPPELLPGPTVRYALLINIMIILLTVTFIGLSSYLYWLDLSLVQQERAGLETQKIAKVGVVADFGRLNKIGMSIDKYGRLIALASDDYVEMPAILDRIAKILPDEVYLKRVTNNRTEGKGLPVILGIGLTASDNNPELMIRTLSAFKNEPLFADCFMPVAEYTEVSLDDVRERYGINWEGEGPDLPFQLIARQYDFEIHSRLNRPLLIDSLTVARDLTQAFIVAEPEPVPTDPAEEAGNQGEET